MAPPAVSAVGGAVGVPACRLFQDLCRASAGDARLQRKTAFGARLANAAPLSSPDFVRSGPGRVGYPCTGTARSPRWAALLARAHEVFPLLCPTCQTPLTFIACLTDPEPITRILAHIGEPTWPPITHPGRGPPQTLLGSSERLSLGGSRSQLSIPYTGQDPKNGRGPDFCHNRPGRCVHCCRGYR
jgi:hypothetical protein